MLCHCDLTNEVYYDITPNTCCEICGLDFTHYQNKYPHLFTADKREHVDYVIRTVYSYKDSNGNTIVQTDRFPILST
jgi:hypothetical protein